MTTASLGAEELTAIVNVGRTVSSHLELAEVLESIMKVTGEVMKVGASSLAIEDEDTGDLLFHVAQGDSADVVQAIRLKRGKGIIGWVVQSGEVAVVNDVSKDRRFFGDVDKDSGFRTRSILCVPLRGSTRVIGAIEVLNKLGDEDFTDKDITLCEAIAGQAAIAIENAMLHKRVVQTERMAAIGQTIAGLGHCIKNVLNGIQGGAFMVDSGIKKENIERLSRGWDIVKKNNTFMQELVLDMLNYSKEREPEYAVCDLNEVVESVCEIVSAKALEKGVQVDWTKNENLGPVYMDPKGIRRSLLNLVSNAVDACESGPDRKEVKVWSDGSPEAGMFSIVISDTGCGISDEVRENLFKVFFSTKGSKGTGLGLAVTHKIVDEHGGRIEVESDVGVGTTFRVYLPRNEEAGSS